MSQLPEKTIGLIGGMSWESSALYYRLINEEVRRRLGGHHNARSVMVTVDFADVERRMRYGDWESIGRQMGDAARQLERGGAEFILLCTNTIHKMADAITDAVSVPFIHIVDVTAAHIQKGGFRRVGLLATRFTMEEPFYRERMREKFGIEIVVPAEQSREALHGVIFNELCKGIIRPESRRIVQGIIFELSTIGAQSIILGCTELELLLAEEDSPLPIHPSTALHARAAVDASLSALPLH